jgi:hypothetical protein
MTYRSIQAAPSKFASFPKPTTIASRWQSAVDRHQWSNLNRPLALSFLQPLATMRIDHGSLMKAESARRKSRSAFLD